VTTFWTIFWFILIVLALSERLINKVRWYRKMLGTTPGWLWFTMDPKENRRQGRVIRVGLTDEDPDTLVPAGIQLLYKQHVRNQGEALKDIAANIGKARVKGAWYEADPVMAYISHLKGEW